MNTLAQAHAGSLFMAQLSLGIVAVVLSIICLLRIRRKLSSIDWLPYIVLAPFIACDRYLTWKEGRRVRKIAERYWNGYTFALIELHRGTLTPETLMNNAYNPFEDMDEFDSGVADAVRAHDRLAVKTKGVEHE